MTPRVLRTCLVAIAVALVCCGTTKAVVYNPDGTHPPYNDPDDFRRDLEIQDWPGEVLASRTAPFEIRVNFEDLGRDLVHTGTVTQEVVRESGTGYLSFHYRVNDGPTSDQMVEFEGVRLHGFETWFTDVRSNVPDGVDFALDRFNGGDTFFHWARVPVEFGLHVVVRTNAPDFAEGGSFQYRVDWDGWGQAGTAGVATFRPVPEPTVAWAVSLIVAGGLLRRRRRPASWRPPHRFRTIQNNPLIQP